jgi:hypothetical protein
MQAPKSRKPSRRAPQQEGPHRAFLGEHHVVEALIGLGELGELACRARAFPVEAAAIDHNAADHRAVAGQEFGRRVVDQVCAVVEGLDQPGRGEGGVHQQRHAGLVRNGTDGGDIEHVQARVTDGFAKEQLGVRSHGGAPAVDVAGLHESGLDAEASQGVVQQVLRAAIEGRAGHDVRARAHQRGDRQVQRRLAAGGGDRADASFKRGHALLKHRVGGVADAAVDVAGALQVEQRRSVVAGFENE